VVFGRRAGRYAAEFAKANKVNGTTMDNEQLQSIAKTALKSFDVGASGENPYQIQYGLQEAMQDLVGIVRTETEMQQALTKIAELNTRAEHVGITGHRQYNNGWHTAIDLGNLLLVSEAVTRAALIRKESRGAQFREDFPNKDPEWGKHNIVIKRGPDGEMLVEKRALAAMPDELQAVIQEMK
jgi:succinate dehydrogenase flavoprotein subunit